MKQYRGAVVGEIGEGPHNLLECGNTVYGAGDQCYEKKNRQGPEEIGMDARSIAL